MFKTLRYKAIICASAVLFLGACKEALDTEPRSSMSEETVVTPQYARQLMNGAYDRMQNVSYYGRDYQVVSDVGGDDVKITADNSNRFLSEFRYLYSSNTAAQTNTWSYIYKTIYAANNIINSLPEDQATSEYKGEAYFVRALGHFDLLRRWARPFTNVSAKPDEANSGIPLVLEKVQDPQSFLPKRSTLRESYAAVIADLKKAQELGRDATQGSDAIFRGSKQSATALLVRVYLYMGDWDNVIAESNKLIGKFSLWEPGSVVNAFKSNKTSEEIFTLKFIATESLGADNFGYIYLPKGLGYGDVRPGSNWISLLGPSDVRSGFLEDEGGITYLSKFPENGEGAVGLVDLKVLRIAEIYLSRAEAYAEKGDISSALTDLNALRTKRGLSSFVSTSISAVKDEIKKQRRLELIGEGHRMFDIFRKNDTRVITDANALSVSPIAPDNFRVIYPIPVSELDANPNVVQNPGYVQ